MTSVYCWQGEIISEQECQLVIKTQAACFDALQQAIQRAHPYEIPEIIAVPSARGLPEYLGWSDASTR